MVRVSPVTVNVAVERTSSKLLPALNSTRPGSMTNAPEIRVAEHTQRDCEREGLRGRRLEVDPAEPNELLGGQRHAGAVRLHHLGAAPAARVGHGEGRPCLASLRRRCRSPALKGAVVERCVTEAVAEDKHGRGRHVEVALVDVGFGPPVAAAHLWA